MKTITKKFPTALEESHQFNFRITKSLQIAEQELKTAKLKNAYLLEQFRLAKQDRFAPKSEKNIYQADLFDEAGTPELISHTIISKYANYANHWLIFYIKKFYFLIIFKQMKVLFKY